VSRRAFLLILLLVGWAVALGAAPTESPYRDLIGWANLRDLRAINRGDTLLLTNRWSRFLFRRDSDRITYNDVELRLSDRLQTGANRWRITQRDIDTLLLPLVSPPKRAGAVTTVAINAGHGGRDPGHLEGPRQEKTYTLALARELRRRLEAAGLKVIMIRDDDFLPSLEDRAATANRRKADLYVSLHFNGAPGEAGQQARGLETYCLTPAGAASSNDTSRRGGGWLTGNTWDRDNITLAHLVHRSVLDQTDLQDRGVRRARFKELTLLRMPGILIEAGYMTNPHDARLIYGTKSREQLAEAIVEGIVQYRRLVARGQPE
jgi:N-acetylmuramoyl-L-alanine amidase